MESYDKYFCPITLKEMSEVLKEEKGWKIAKEGREHEYVFNFPLSTSPHIIIKVCSSISENNNMSRKCGTDAIRVFAVNTKTNKGWISTRKVKRIGTWKKNLINAVTDIFEQAKNRRDA